MKGRCGPARTGRSTYMAFASTLATMKLRAQAIRLTAPVSPAFGRPPHTVSSSILPALNRGPRAWRTRCRASTP